MYDALSEQIKDFWINKPSKHTKVTMELQPRTYMQAKMYIANRQISRYSANIVLGTNCYTKVSQTRVYIRYNSVVDVAPVNPFSEFPVRNIPRKKKHIHNKCTCSTFGVQSHQSHYCNPLQSLKPSYNNHNWRLYTIYFM